MLKVKKEAGDIRAMKAYLEPEEVERLEQSGNNIRDRLLIKLLWHLGCRVSEAIALEVGNIDLEQGTVTIQHLKSRIKLNCPKCSGRLGKSHSFCPKCGNEVKGAVSKEYEHRRMRTLPLDKDTLEMLEYYIDRGGIINKNGKASYLRHKPPPSLADYQRMCRQSWLASD